MMFDFIRIRHLYKRPVGNVPGQLDGPYAVLAFFFPSTYWISLAVYFALIFKL